MLYQPPPTPTALTWTLLASPRRSRFASNEILRAPPQPVIDLVQIMKDGRMAVDLKLRILGTGLSLDRP